MTVSMDRILEQMAESRHLSETFWNSCADHVAQAGAAMIDALRAGHKVLTMGNGGSAADAQHLADELVNRFETERPALPGISLATDNSNLTAIGNDRSFEEVFSRQIEALGRPGDILIAFTTSGTSPNILKGLEAGGSIGMTRIGFLGRDGGAAKPLCEHPIVVPHKRTSRIQEVHLQVLHALCSLVDGAFC